MEKLSHERWQDIFTKLNHLGQAFPLSAKKLFPTIATQQQ
jgi:hypothetical protein